MKENLPGVVRFWLELDCLERLWRFFFEGGYATKLTFSMTTLNDVTSKCKESEFSCQKIRNQCY